MKPTGSIIDVTQPPYNADPRGVRDSTDALIAAINTVVSMTQKAFEETVKEIAALPGANGYLSSGVENRKKEGKVIGIFPSQLVYVPTIYLPRGVYQVSDTVRYTVIGLQNSLGSELNRQIRFKGDGADVSILQLKDGAVGFDGDKPKPVLSLMQGTRSNVSMSNYVEDLGIDTGTGNPSAVGLDFFANNSGAVRKVRITSGDGKGFAGLTLGHANYSGVLLKEIEVEGFDYGLHLTTQTESMYAVCEDIKLKRLNVAGILAGSVPLSLRRIEVEGAPVGVICEERSGSVALVDSMFNGHGPAAIRNQGGALYLSGIRTEGFEMVVDSENGVDPGWGTVSSEGKRALDQWAFPETFSASGRALMKRLEVEETPELIPVRVEEGTVGLHSFGAKGDGVHDDTEAIQRALHSGAAGVIFEPGRYLLTGQVSIPGSVRHLDFNFVDLVSGGSLADGTGGAFVIGEESDAILHIERLFAWELWRGKHYTFEHAAKRTLVLKDIHTQTLPLYCNSISGGTVFLENVATTAGVIPGASGHGRIPCSFRGQRVWARQLNPERGEPMVLNDGGSLWVLGFKSEDAGVAFHTINGGRTEVIGGVLNSGRTYAAAFLNEDASTRIACTSNGWERGANYGIAIREIRKGVVEDMSAAAMPLRGLPESRGAQFSIPLYLSREYKED